MTTFTYTDHADTSSELVEGLYYNEATRELALDLNDSIYVYRNVPAYTFREFRDAPSKGRYFQNFKRTFGPSERVGYWDEVDFQNGTPAPAMDDPRTLVGAGSVDKGAVDTGNGVNTTINVFSLETPGAGNSLRKHTVVFTVGSDSKENEHNVNVVSVDEAVKAVQDIAAMLGLTFNVKRVVTHF